MQHLVDESNRAFGKIDVLVCNAASNPYYGPLGGISDEQFRKILDNNIVANNWLISMVVPQMIERKDGSIVIVSSIGGLKGSTVLGAYAISKAADMQLARNLACEYGKHNIRVNCIAPGLIKTDFAKALWDNPETLKASTARSPLLAHRHSRRDRRRRGADGIGRRQFHDRADHRDRRRRDDQLMNSRRPGLEPGPIQRVRLTCGRTTRRNREDVVGPGSLCADCASGPGRQNYSTAAYTEIAQQVADLGALAGALHHEHGEQVFGRVDEEERAGHAAPEELADRSRERRDAGGGADRRSRGQNRGRATSRASRP